ncbi:putative serine/threonine protein kinase SKS1 NDAI_0E03210 [Naumovozyma dairenensis CBS 421]|uniref:non-specific serine/threonine protein kinase n=1 Tax=Naumovozyma dairenensis (strain ATCC 10597 / BCRC 20456 / CBS 421 / NBRC 0211 / NRRL Y-12639) TaxID=1071378 RepID=G0WBL8_NAUDC|nr:hypothetical protein NDAI_0E03210 [Naumovozyma dairenensis CBS 421]CCD25138.1 hypothetical protein NDAI_0E03210 [Naumovozyma dairenensis CBS 421]
MLTNCQINNLVLRSQVGSGAFGLVFHAIDIVSQQEYAIKAVLKTSPNDSNNSTNDEKKQIKKSTILQDKLYHYFKEHQNRIYLPSVDLESIKNLTEQQLYCIPHYKEINFHLKVHDHANIVTIHQILESQIATFIVMDYYPIDLFSSIVEHKHFSNDGLLVKKVFLQLCSALNYCHQQNIYHCDIKPENILLDRFDNIHLCDFGLATYSSYLAPNTCVGSSYYMAPERVFCNGNGNGNNNDNNGICNDQNVCSSFPTISGDIWSLGIILINLTCIRNPWLKAHQLEDNTYHHFAKDNTILQKILPISNEFFQLLSNILKINPFERLTINSLIQNVENLASFTVDGPLSSVPQLIPIYDNNNYYNINAVTQPNNNNSLSLNELINDYADDPNEENNRKWKHIQLIFRRYTISIRS